MEYVSDFEAAAATRKKSQSKQVKKRHNKQQLKLKKDVNSNAHYVPSEKGVISREPMARLGRTKLRTPIKPESRGIHECRDDIEDEHLHRQGLGKNS